MSELPESVKWIHLTVDGRTYGTITRELWDMYTTRVYPPLWADPDKPSILT